MGTSHQKGWVMVRGKKWYGYFRRTVLDPVQKEPKPVITPVVLGLKSQMTKFEAREKLVTEIARLTGHITEEGVVRNGSVTFDWFVHNRYLPLKEADWKEESAKNKRYLIQADLVDAFKGVRLENIDKLALQAHLNSLAKTRSRDRVLQMRAYLRDIFAEAVDQDFLVKDPARKLRTPANLRETDKTVLTWDQLRSALSALNLRDWILLKLDMTNALRPGELFAFRWSCLDAKNNKLHIRETIYKGKVRPWGKTKGSLTAIPIAGQLVEELQAWREQCREEQKKKKTWYGPTADDPEAFIFPGRNGGFIDADNYRKRVLHKLAMELELPKLTFQVIRRTIATLAGGKGHVKDIQGMLRHSRAATTTDVYMQTMEEGVRSTVTSIHEELMGTGTLGQPPMAGAVRHETGKAFAGEGNFKGGVAPTTSSEGKEMSSVRPVRGKVLQFATKMLPSREAGQSLNS